MKISSNRKLKCVKSNAPTTPSPTNHNQGDKAVTIRPPSRNPMGARLKRLRKKPLKARARNIGLALARYIPSHTAAPAVASNGPPMPTCASIHAFGGASLSAMNAPMNGMKTGAPTFNPMRLAASKCPHSWTKMSSTKPSAYHQPQAWAYSQMVRNMLPPVFNNTGKNFRAGTSSALNFRSKTPRTPTGTKAFFNVCPPPGRGGWGVTTGGNGGGGASINKYDPMFT